MSALESAFWGAGWDESKHKRQPKDTPVGGQFASKVTVTVGPVEVRGEGYTAQVWHGGEHTSTLPAEIVAWKEEVPREYAQKAYFAAKEPDNHLIVVRRDGELIGVGQFTDTGGPELHGGYFGAVKGGGLPLFNAFLEEAEKRGVGAVWEAGNERAAQLYNRLGIPYQYGKPTMEEYEEFGQEFGSYEGYVDVWREEFGTSYALTADQVRLLSNDMFALARQKGQMTSALAYLIASGEYDESEHPRWPAGHPLGGQWRPKDSGVLPAEYVVKHRTLKDRGVVNGSKVWTTEDGRYALVGDDPDDPDFEREYQVLYDPDGGLTHDTSRGGQVMWVKSFKEGQREVSKLVDAEEEQEALHPTYELRYNEEMKKLTLGEETSVNWELYSPERAKIEREIEAQVQAEEDRKYRDRVEGHDQYGNEIEPQERFKVKVGEAKNLRSWLEENYYREHTTDISYPNGHPIRITDPMLKSALENWGNWTTSELSLLQTELRKQLSEGSGNYRGPQSGLLSVAYGKEVGHSEMARARNEARRLLDPLDKAYYTQTMGEDWTRDAYPELFEVKAPKVKNVSPRDQGVPDIYLSEKGTFKPGYDAKLKRDLVASAMEHHPMEIKPGTLSKETEQWAVDEWKGRNPSMTQDSEGREYSDSEMVGVALRDIHDPSQREKWPDDLRKAIQAETQSRWRDVPLHRFEPETARRILEERGWTKYLRQQEDKFNVTEVEPTREAVVAKEIAERNWGSALTIRGFQYGKVQEWTNAMAEFEPGVVDKLVSRGGNVHYGPGPSTDQDDMHSLYNERGGGWGNTHLDKVGGFYSPSSKSVVMGTGGRGGSANVTAHEVGHMIGNVLGVDESDRLYEFHKKLYPQLDTYFRQQGRGGFRGRKELWAEGVGVVMENRSRKRRGLEPTTNSGPFKGHPLSTWNTPTAAEAAAQAEYYEWVDKALVRLDELPDEAFNGRGSQVAPPGWKWRKDAILGINVLEPEGS